MTVDQPPRATVVVPADVAATLARLTDALPAGVVLVGGWAVTCRLRMARSRGRPTEDVDVLLGRDARPARAALAAVAAIQDTPEHPCRLSGLPALVDLLADTATEVVASPGFVDERIEDVDGLRLLVPPFGELLVRTAEPTRLAAEDGSEEAVVLLPRAGALLAVKVANIALEFRSPEKRAGDGEDAARLIEAFGSLALRADLEAATAPELADLRRHLEALGGGGLHGQARAGGYDPDRRRLEAAVADLVTGCS